MVRRQRATNKFTTLLDGSVNNSTTSWTVDSVSGLPSEGDFYIACEEEIVLVTAISSLTLTVIRGQCGSTAASHGDNAQVTTIITAEEFDNRMKDHGLVKALPYGRITTDTPSILTATNFTLSNGSSSTITDGLDGVITLESRLLSGDDTVGAVRSFSSGSGDKRIIAHIAAPSFRTAGPDKIGFCQRQATGGSMTGIELTPNNGDISYISRTSFIASATKTTTHGSVGRRDFWAMMTIEWDVTPSDRFTWYYSWDGVHWFQFGQQVFAAVTAEVGFWQTNRTLANQRVQLLSWHEEAL